MIIALQTLIFFRESLIAVLDRFLRPYYKRLSFQFKVNEIFDDDDDSDEHVFAEFDDEKGVVFYPPVYVQRYAAVVDCLMDERWCGSLEKVVDFGYHNMSFIKYLKDVPGLKYILGVDIETIPVRCSSDLLECENYVSKTESPLQVTLFQGNAADPDYRLIGCDAVIAIEMIEHMLPHDLERFVHTVFGFIKPRVAIITTPNGDFNVLFKALEKNGLRRLDHFFEWSREQFHDWCSNIVARYPQYTVMSKGIGPGPPDTLHLGCCSQLALFYAKDYQKQPDLNLNSLALVAKAPNPNNFSEMTDSWETPDSISDNMLYLENNDESYTKLLINQQSFMTIVITTPSFSLDNLGSQDKTLQCNLDYELEKNFLFDDEVYVNVLIPRRKRMYRVYEIEDVASRLNCSMLQVKKFSKVTLGLLAKNKTDNFDHTREVVDEIRHLTKMLNFNKDQSNKNILGSIWCNINWGENAPYWNQYYKTVREYTYPFEIKSDECRILDAISEEINRLIDVDQPENFTTDTQKLEIPIRQLMEAVEHITTDVDKVKDLLEWNGYDVVDDVVIHTRLTMDNMSLHTQEEDLQEDSLSDWDTSDVRSNTISEGSATLPDYNGRCLRRALDQKVRKLRKLLTADEDITTELDRIVCRLMKLALYTTKDRQDPPPASWMQCKLFDLLTLTEKAIERRRRHFLESYPLNSIEYCSEKHNDENIINTLSTDDSAVKDIVSKYNDVLAPSDFNIVEVRQEAQLDDMEFDDVVSVTTNDLEEYDDYNNDISPTHEVAEELKKNVTIDHFGFEEVNNMKSINPQALQDSDHTELVSSPSCESNNYASNETLPNESNDNDNDSKVISPSTDITDISRSNNDKSPIKLSVCKVNDTLLEPKYATKQKAFKNKSTKTKTVKKVSSKLINGQYKIKNRKIKEHQKLRSTLSKPIPDSMITLCNAEKYIEKTVEDIYVDSSLEGHMDTEKVNNIFEELRDIAAAEDSLFVGIVSEYGEESIALRRNIGIDPIIDFEIVDNEVLETVINISKDDDFLSKGNMDTENLSSDTIFIYDINEPSTSKGVRHLSTDVQCGPDNSLTCATISATTSSTIIPNLFSNGMKIKNSLADIRVHKRMTNDFSTCTELLDPAPRLAGLPIAIGIKIKDSDIDIIDTSRIKCPTIVHAVDDKEIQNISNRYENAKETKLEKLKCSIIKIEDSSSELCGSLCDSTKPLSQFIVSSKNANENKVKLLSKINNLTERSQISYAKNKLIFGGIHVHSYKERIYSEDVVYQGNWQRSRPLRRINSKNSQELIIRRSKSLQKKKDTNPKKQMDAIKTLKNFNVIKPTKHSITSTVKQIKLNEANKKPLNKNKYKTLTKATSIMKMSSQKSQNRKQFYSKNYALDLNATRQNKDDLKSFKKNDYVPTSIRKKRQHSNENCDSTINFDPRVKSCNKNNAAFFYALKEEITKELLKFTENMKINNNFIVLRNENETKSNTNKPISTTNTEIVDSNTLNRSIELNRSPPSQNSSPCSSPNSVATVRAVFTRNKAHRRDSPSSDRSNSGFESENKALKNKNSSKRYKSNKKSSNKPAVMCYNKENIPESSKNLFSCKKDIPKTSNCAFVGKTKSVFMAQAATGHSKLQLTPPAVMKNNLKKPNTMYDLSNNKHDNYLSDALNSKKLLKNSYDLDNSHSDCKEECSPSISSNNNVSTLQSIEDEQSLYSDTDKNENSDTLDSPPSNNANRSLHSTRSSIMSAIRQLIEQKIHINESNSNDSIISASETIILNGEDINNSSFNSSLSPLSITTIIPNQNSTLECDIQNTLDKISRTGLNDSILSSPDVKPLTNKTEIDSISLKSSDLSSISTSKFSEYYLADNELENALNVSSVQDIFERNDRNVITNVDGLLAAQAFSGFSMNSGSFVGDRIDHVNLIDSETGSIALCSARQAVSEELFVSSRSSDTYESCFYEDDIYVPNWLFNIISQQPSIAESEVEEDFLPIPLGEPVFDVNGNALEPGVGFGAGAGDGRGMHSDQSQDSSGRGTSLSSSATSSGQNEPILIDLSTITPHYTQYVHEPMNVNEVSTDNDEINETHRSVEGDTMNDVFERVRNTNAVQITSDVDADVSSLDTDAVDSDD
ncbi:uncharacterized protein LOC125074500 [Vanessa atalanta]|uniref:uncharacterized protein LOC125074500 n=1 Tax=Vanessa atalanta TaxID=42275 RepID=UPI001FCD508A|nr:uncharacterized protein LOC125074500 [Vanessa atalanta]